MSELKNVVLLTTELPTKNNVVFPKVEVEKALSEVKLPLVGYLNGGIYDHDLEEASHEITDIKFDGNRLVGTITTLDTSRGKILHDLIESKNIPTLAMSCSAGNIKFDGRIKTVVNVTIKSFNYVSN